MRRDLSGRQRERESEDWIGGDPVSRKREVPTASRNRRGFCRKGRGYLRSRKIYFSLKMEMNRAVSIWQNEMRRD